MDVNNNIFLINYRKFFFLIVVQLFCVFQVCPVDMIIFFDVSNNTLISRLVGRAAAATVKREDDNEETIKKRIEIFNEKNGKIVDHYKNKCVRVS
jgi:adenylate kinase